MSPASPTARILLITTDHMRADCIAAHGNDLVHTPNLDRLVEGGTTFRGCYAQNPVCMPSRASLFTGLYPQQTGVTTNGYKLPPGVFATMPQLLEGAGYDSCHVGKLHLQPHEEHDLRAEPDEAYGFRAFMRSEARGCYRDAYVRWLTDAYPDLLDTFRLTRPMDPRRHTEERGPRVLDAPWEASHSGWIATEACQWLNGAFGNRLGHRTFTHLGFHNPHPPLNPTRAAFEPYDGLQIPPPVRGEAEWEDKPDALAGMLRSRRNWSDEEFIEYRRHFYALVTEMDLAVGRVLAMLEEAGALEDTLIVFTSDHGDMCGDHGMTHKGPHFYDAVMNVPLVMHWPAGFGSERRDVDRLVELTDVLPTLLDLVGVPAPAPLVGRSLAAVLLEGAEPDRDDVLAVDQAGAMLRTETHKLIRFTDGGEVLFDLTDAHPEVRNLATDESAGGVLGEMRDRMLQRLLKAARSSLERRLTF